MRGWCLGSWRRRLGGPRRGALRPRAPVERIELLRLRLELLVQVDDLALQSSGPADGDESDDQGDRTGKTEE